MGQQVAGVTLDAHLEQFYKSKGIERSPDDDLPGCPLELDYLWREFLRMSARRPYTVGSPLPVPFREIQAFAQLHELNYEVWELEVLEELDSLAIPILVKNQKDAQSAE